MNVNPYINIFKKLCPKCNTEKDCTEFFTQKSNKDGLRSWCKICHTQNCLKYNKLNKDKVLKTIRERVFMRRSTDLGFKIVDSLRNRLHQAILKNYKSGSAVKDLGCSIEFFKTYIESLFYSNMTWDNWGPIWELDHINELHTFDLTDREQFLIACHYTNMQPLTIEDHKKKTVKNYWKKTI
jgi:hypothetical protein